MKFLKILFIFVGVIVLLLGILVFIASQTINPERIKSMAEDRLTQELNKPTRIGSLDIGLSLSTGLSLQAGDVEIKDLFSVNKMDLQLDAKRFLTKKEIVIPKVIIDAPRIRWTPQSREGLPIDQQANANQSTTQAKTSNPETEEIGHFSIEEIVITNGSFQYQDEIEGRPLDVTVDQLNLSIQDFVLDRPFPYTLSFGLMTGDKPLTDIKGQAVIVSRSRQLIVNDLDIRVLIKNLILEEIARNAPEIRESGLKEIRDGELHFAIPELAVGEAGLKDLSVQGDLKSLDLVLDALPVPVKADAMVTANLDAIQLENLKVQAGQGLIEGKATVTDYMASQLFQSNVRLRDVQVSELVDLSQMNLQVRAGLNGDFDFSGKGFDEQALENHLSGTATLRLEDAKILDFNLLDYVLEQLPQAINLGGLENLLVGLRSNLGQRYQDEFNKKDTEFQVTDIVVKIAAGHLIMQETDFGAEGYLVRVAADLGMDGQLELQSAMLVSPEMSAEWIQKVPELSSLQDDQGQIRIAFKDYRGPIEKLAAPIPDIKNVVRQYYEQKGKQELKNVLRKALDLDDAPTVTNSGTQQLEAGQQGQPNNQQEIQPEELLLDVVDGLLQKW